MTRSALTSGATKIACGGPAVSPFIADTDFTGGDPRTRANTIDTSAVYQPAPAAIYQSQRFGNFSYTLPGFTVDSWNQIRLHFADTHWTAAGSRLFNVTINGKQVLTNFDIVKTVGAGNKALVETFMMPANASGQYVIQFAATLDAATVSAIEVGPVAFNGTPTNKSGTAYATQCAQQLVPIPPNFGGGGTGAGTCAACFAGAGPCIGCTAGAWKYAGQVSGGNNQSFNGPAPVDIFYWESTTASTPGMCMMATRQAGETAVDFHGVMCQSSGGAVCYWDLAQPGQLSWTFSGGGAGEAGHVVIPATAKVIASTTSIPNPPAFVGGSDLVFANNGKHSYQNECSDCHAGRNTFNNHPGTATDVFGRGLVSAANYFPKAWPAPIVPDWDPLAALLGKPWARNPTPFTFNYGNTSCNACHKEQNLGQTPAVSGGFFPTVSTATPLFCDIMLWEATHRTNNDCPNTWPWTPNGTPAPDIHCPSGAMAPSSLPSSESSYATDQFALQMLSPHIALCNAEFRTTLAAPKGPAVTLATGLNTLTTNAFGSRGFPGGTAITVAVNSAGKVVLYDPIGMKWITTTGTGATENQVTLGSDTGIWALRKSGTSSFICAATAASCGTNGACAWACDATSVGNFAQIVSGTGQVIWAIDAGLHTVYGYLPPSTASYPSNHTTWFGFFDSTDPIAQMSAGGDGENWILTTTGKLSRQTGGPFVGNWVAKPNPSGVTPVSVAVANVNDVWIAASTGLYKYLSATNSWERHCLTTGCSQGFTAVAAGGTDDGGARDAEVWALDSAGNAYRVDRRAGSTTNSISKITGATLTRISVGNAGDVMGINSAGSVFSFQGGL